jgi:hypothetical protein
MQSGMSHTVLVLRPIFDTRLLSLMCGRTEVCHLLTSILGAEKLVLCSTLREESTVLCQLFCSAYSSDA